MTDLWPKHSFCSLSGCCLDKQNTTGPSPMKQRGCWIILALGRVLGPLSQPLILYSHCGLPQQLQSECSNDLGVIFSWCWAHCTITVLFLAFLTMSQCKWPLTRKKRPGSSQSPHHHWGSSKRSVTNTQKEGCRLSQPAPSYTTTPTVLWQQWQCDHTVCTLKCVLSRQDQARALFIPRLSIQLLFHTNNLLSNNVWISSPHLPVSWGKLMLQSFPVWLSKSEKDLSFYMMIWVKLLGFFICCTLQQELGQRS